jgi:tetratricopeptide (TPR) repeat protein
MATPSEHPLRSSLVALVEGRLSSAEVDRVKAHVDSCPSCGAAVAELSGGAVAARSRHGGSEPSTLGESRAVDRPAFVFQARERGASVGRYLVLSRIGRGGMGEVYEAYDPQLDRRVALKLLHTATESQSARDRLSREAWALAQLSHPNVVHVYEAGEQDGDVFMAMELVDGESLDVWRRGSARPDWRAVVEAYLEAARGLAAAHDKGLVHRDVKPANILRGKDGRVRVVDFGLVARRHEAPDSAAPAAGPDSDVDRDARLTSTGTILGTPIYMAPEQFARGEASAASDQYGLCVALYDALAGRLPFDLGSRHTVLHILAEKEKPPRPAPAGTGVPAAVFDVLARGLSPRAADRYPSMRALADALALAAAPRSHALARWIAAGVAAAVVVAVGAAGWARSGAFTDPCAHPERHLAGVWDDDVKQRVRAALLQSGRPYAADTVARITALLDRQAASYANMRGEVCTASRTQTQGPTIVALREACLERRRTQLQALTTLLAERSDPRVLDRGVQAALELTPVEGCADVDALTSRVRPPEDPALRARVNAVQPKIDRLEALYNTGQYKAGLAEGGTVVAEAEGVPYPLLLAQAKVWFGMMHANSGDYEQAKTLLREAAALGAEAGDDVLVARSWARILYIAGLRQAHFDEANVIRGIGPTLLARAHDDRARAAWLSAEGLTLGQMGRYDEAKAAGQQAVALAQKSVGPEHTFVADTMINLSDVFQRTNENAEALRLNERALAIRVALLGPDHPLVGGVLQNIAVQLQCLGQPRRAIETYERALAITQGVYGPENPDVATMMDSLASTRADVGEWDEALPMSEKALVIREAAFGPDNPWVALSTSNLGEILLRRGDLERAAALFERSVAIGEKAQGPTSAEIADPLANLARVRVRQGRLGEAPALLDRVRALVDKPELHDDPVLARAFLVRGELALASGKSDEAVGLLEHALAVRGERARPNDAAETKLTLADALWRAGTDRPRARAVAQEARVAYESIGHRPGTDAAARWLAGHAP